MVTAGRFSPAAQRSAGKSRLLCHVVLLVFQPKSAYKPAGKHPKMIGLGELSIEL